MGYKYENSLYHKTWYTLLRMTEYNKFFDSHKRGGLYRILASKIYRRGVDSLQFYNEAGELTQLAKLYDKGELATFFTDEQLSSDLGLTPRRIEDLRKDLVAAKAVNIKKFKDGYIYTLGKRIHDDMLQGFGDGEMFFVDHWLALAVKDPEFLRFAFVSLFASEQQQNDFFCSMSEENFVVLRKKFRNQYPTQMADTVRLGEEIRERKKSSIEKHTNRKEKNTTVSAKREKTEEVQEASQEDQNQSAPKKDLKKNKKSKKETLSPEEQKIALWEKFKASDDFQECIVTARKGMAIGFKPMNSYLTRKLKTLGVSSELADRFPRFAWYIQSENYQRAKSDSGRLATMWQYLREDLDYTPTLQKEYSKALGSAAGWFTNHPYTLEQYQWTILQIINEAPTVEKFKDNFLQLIYITRERDRQFKAHKENVVYTEFLVNALNERDENRKASEEMNDMAPKDEVVTESAESEQLSSHPSQIQGSTIADETTAPSTSSSLRDMMRKRLGRG